MENSFKHQIHQIQRTTGRNGKTEYRGWTYAKNEVVLEPGWISDAFLLHEPEVYKLVTTITLDDEIQNIYTVPVGRCNQQTSVEESKYEEKRQIALIASCESISKKGPSKILEKKKIRLYIVPGAPTLFYQQGNHNSFILSSLVSALHYMGDGYASEYIIERNKRSPLEIQNKGRMHFCRDILMGNHKEKTKKTQLLF